MFALCAIQNGHHGCDQQKRSERECQPKRDSGEDVRDERRAAEKRCRAENSSIA